MYLNYLLTTLRTIKQNKLIVIINLLSVSLAFSLCTIAYFNYEFNHYFNSFYNKADNIYKVNAQRSLEATRTHTGASPMMLKESIQDEFDDVDIARIVKKGLNIKRGNKLFREQIAFIDREFLTLFEFPSVHGEFVDLRNKSGVLLSKATAVRLFGDTNVEGEVIAMLGPDGTKYNFDVEGVIEKFPANTSFRFSMLMLMDNYFDVFDLSKNDWSVWVDGTFIHCKDEGRISSLEKVSNNQLEIQNLHNKGQELEGYVFDSFKYWPQIESELHRASFVGTLHPAAVLGTISSAIAILLLACFNFINSSIAISRKRLKEIAVRKIIGGSQFGLRIQFLTETVLLMFVAIVFSGLISYYLSGPYNALFAFEIVQFEFVHIEAFVIFLINTLLIVGLISGLYPAFYISRFDSLHILNNKVKFSSKNLFTKILLTFQFAICFYNVFALFIFVENSYYQDSLDRGYDVDQVLNVPLSSSDQYAILDAAIDQIPMIDRTGGTRDLIGFSSSEMTLEFKDMKHQISALQIGEGYLETLGIRQINGQSFADAGNSDRNIIINEMLAGTLGSNHLHQNVILGGKQYKVIGTVEDFNLKSIMLNNKISPTVITLADKSTYSHLAIRAKADDIIDVNKSIEDLWYSHFPNELYRGFYQEDVMEQLNMTNNIMVTINIFIAFVSLLISALGLYSLVALTIQGRIKEFGIRKVLGAPFLNIVHLMNRDILILLSISAILGLIGGNFFISSLLDIIYAYHIRIDFLHFIWPVITILVITSATIGYKIIKSASENPIVHLKYE